MQYDFVSLFNSIDLLIQGVFLLFSLPSNINEMNITMETSISIVQYSLKALETAVYKMTLH